MKKAEINQALDVNINTVTNVCRTFQSQGSEVIGRKKPDREYTHSAEIELSALVRQCLHRRIPDLRTLDAESQAWAKERSEKVVKIDWRFTTDDARIKLKHLYPKI